MYRFGVIALTALVLCGCVGSRIPDSQRIIGDWVVVDFRSPNEAEDRSQRRKHAIVNEGTWSQQFQGERYEEFEYALDPSTTPKHIDLIYTDPAGKRLTIRGIYDFPDREHLRVCFGSPPVVKKDGKAAYVESVRPTAFEPQDGPLISYRRAE
jgi:uncharacterized protein (TIGR03067 family)